jgi:polysaccharide deacetylase family protein (PEP-CTERM system associated)
MPGATTRNHVLTVSVEEYFHHGAFTRALQQKHWDRFESRLAKNVDDTLALLDANGAQATFFVHGSTAERQPEIVRAIRARGHEVASRGFWPNARDGMTRTEFQEDLARTREALERAGSGRIRGYRAPRWLRDGEEWILDVLADEGYAYDASVNPILRRFAADARFRVAHERIAGVGRNKLWEFPVSTVGFGGIRLAISGGNYLRQLPQSLVRRAVEWWDRNEAAPLVFYFMPWELDSEQPRVATQSRLADMMHYRNLDRTRRVLGEYLQRYRFRSIASELGLARDDAADEVRAPAASAARRAAAPDAVPLSLVVPIYDEMPTLAYLRRTLLRVREELKPGIDLRLILVDDGSKDGSRDALARVFGDVEDCEIVLHERNRGVAAAILTGIQHARTELVAAIDADCSYDPLSLREMVPLARDADVVTASPYHPRGRVQNVPHWRLFLSKTLSRIYDRLLHDRICTYTSCFRVYRRSVAAPIRLTDEGFPGVAELLIRMQRRGARIVEYPTTLESRLLGASKMKTLRTIRGHLRLLRRLMSEDSAAKDEGAPPPVVPTVSAPAVRAPAARTPNVHAPTSVSP